jgi:hypothetical protein
VRVYWNGERLRFAPMSPAEARAMADAIRARRFAAEESLHARNFELLGDVPRHVVDG